MCRGAGIALRSAPCLTFPIYKVNPEPEFLSIFCTGPGRLAELTIRVTPHDLNADPQGGVPAPSAPVSQEGSVRILLTKPCMEGTSIIVATASSCPRGHCEEPGTGRAAMQDLNPFRVSSPSSKCQAAAGTWRGVLLPPSSPVPPFWQESDHSRTLAVPVPSWEHSASAYIL